MKGIRFALAILCIITSPYNFAGTTGKVCKPIDCSLRPFLSLSLGNSWSNPGRQQTIFVQPDFPQTYTARNNIRSSLSGEVFLGLYRQLTERFQGQLGFALAGTSSVHPNGDIWQDADAEFNNFYYSYRIRHLHAAVRGKFLPDINRSIQPYATGSIGIAFNHAYHYSSTSKLPEVPEEPPFGSHTQRSLTYTVGGGIQQTFCRHYVIGIGYEFADWGKTRLGNTVDQFAAPGLKTEHLYTHQLLVSLTFIA